MFARSRNCGLLISEPDSASWEVLKMAEKAARRLMRLRATVIGLILRVRSIVVASKQRRDGHPLSSTMRILEAIIGIILLGGAAWTMVRSYKGRGTRSFLVLGF